MTYSILNDCLTIWQSTQEIDKHGKLLEYFQTINVPIFDTLLGKEDKDKAAILVMFSVLGYSEDSPMIVLKQDSIQERRNICTFLGVKSPKEIEEIAYLRDPELKQAVTDYMVQFCGEEFRSLMFCKIQLADYDYDITNRKFRDSVEESTGDKETPTKIVYYYDSKEHGKAVMERIRLAKEIEKMEKTELQKNKHKFAELNKLEDWVRTGGVKTVKTRRTGHPEALIKRATK